MSVRRLSAVLAVLAATVGITASSVFGAHARSNATITVTSSEFKFALSTKSAPAGKVTFKVTNKGSLQHDFWIAGKKTPLLSKGKSAMLTVTIKKGANAYKCTVAGHASAGMKGSFTGK